MHNLISSIGKIEPRLESGEATYKSVSIDLLAVRQSMKILNILLYLYYIRCIKTIAAVLLPIMSLTIENQNGKKNRAMSLKQCCLANCTHACQYKSLEEPTINAMTSQFTNHNNSVMYTHPIKIIYSPLLHCYLLTKINNYNTEIFIQV